MAATKYGTFEDLMKMTEEYLLARIAAIIYS